jgi:hypothetical protein
MHKQCKETETLLNLIRSPHFYSCL